MGLDSGLVGRSSLFRSLSASWSVDSALAEQSSLFRSLSASWSTDSALVGQSSFFRSLSDSLSVAVSQAKGLGVGLTASLTVDSGLVPDNFVVSYWFTS